MIVGVDASSVRTGGGLTHLSRLLAVAQPEQHGIREIRVFANRETLSKLSERPGVSLVHEPWLDRSLPWRILWQLLHLPRRARECDMIFAPGGSTPYRVQPLVTMCRNMLPFEWSELRRYGISLVALRLLLLRFGQSTSFRRADAVIFLTRYAFEHVSQIAAPRRAAIIPHGVEERFRRLPRPQRPLAACDEGAPLRLLYVSIIDTYKHQWHVAEAVRRLREAGLPLVLDFVGPAYPPALPRFEQTIASIDPEGIYLRYRGPVPHAELHELQGQADCFVFASSCENMPNILLEAMAAGLPIACSRRGPMPEILKSAGVYFDPTRPDEIAQALESLARDHELRARCAAEAHEIARAYSWERCAHETLGFLAEVARDAGVQSSH